MEFHIDSRRTICLEAVTRLFTSNIMIPSGSVLAGIGQQKLANIYFPMFAQRLESGQI